MKRELISRRGGGGFSIFEMMIVVAVIAIIVLISGPSMKDMLENFRVDEVAMGIYTDFLKAKSTAILKQDDVVAIFDTQHNRYSILYDAGSDWLPGQSPGSGAYYIKQNVTLPPHYTFAGSAYGVYGVDNEGLGMGVTLKNNVVYFQPSGRASDDHADTIDTLVKSNNRAVYIARADDTRRGDYAYIRAIALDGLSGQPRVYKYRGAWLTRY
jgi:Tfp pilus assembly protein FimT